MLICKTVGFESNAILLPENTLFKIAVKTEAKIVIYAFLLPHWQPTNLKVCGRFG
jgi:hypothetical protein